MRGHGARWAVLVGCVTVLALGCWLAVAWSAVAYTTYRVAGWASEPTLQDNDLIIVSRAAYWFHQPRRGDLVVFRHPNASGGQLIKRVIGMPRERLRIEQGQVYIDGRALDEPYISGPSHSSANEQIVPDGELYVLGDNRSSSSDSRSWGTLPMGNVVGKVIFRYGPPQRFGRPR